MKIVEIITPRLIEGPLIDGRIVPRLPDGSPPKILYRVMSRAEYQAGAKVGHFTPRERTHASATPLFQFAEPGDQNVVVAIDYDDRDGWQAKWMSDEVVAVTHESIPMAKVHLVAQGTRRDLEAHI